MAIEVATIEYATSVDDVVAFNQFHMKKSRTGKRARDAWTAAGAIVPFPCILAVTMTLNESVFSARPIGLEIVLPIAAAGSVLGAVGMRRIFERSVNRTVRRMLGEGQNKAVLGWHRLALGERALREESEVSSEEILYRGLERVSETETHVFIYTGGTAAIVVPKASVNVGELAPFVAELKRRISDAA
jgi:hypothetical protein